MYETAFGERNTSPFKNRTKRTEETRRGNRGTGSRLIIRCIINWMFLHWSVRLKVTMVMTRKKRKTFKKIDRRNSIDDGPAKRAPFVFQFQTIRTNFLED